MKTLTYPRIGEKAIWETLPNGLPICVVPKPGYARKFAFFTTRYGGMDMRFQLDGQWLDTPAGIAHYLEHKMFDTADGSAMQDLARGDEEELLKLWEGLGYYSRARNLQKAARIVAEDYAGAFPADYKELIALPGIGDYTAGAILSIAFGLPVPAVDGNVLRIASRITGWDRDVQSTKKEITRWMTEVVPSDRPGAFNQALMDLGSALCLPAAPRCPDCPLRGLCTAEREESQARIPVRAPKKDKRPEEKTVFLLRRPDGAVALGQRPKTGLLAGLWEYPNVPGLLTEAQAARQLAAWGLTPLHWEESWQAIHLFTHVRWQMQGYAVLVSGEGDLSWYSEEQRRQKAIPSAFEKANRILQKWEGE